MIAKNYKAAQKVFLTHHSKSKQHNLYMLMSKSNYLNYVY